MKQKHALDLYAIFYCIGNVPLLFLSSLPSNNIVVLLLIIIFLLFVVNLVRFRIYFHCLFFLFLSLFWSTYSAQSYLDSTLTHIDKELQVIAKACSINVTDNYIGYDNNIYRRFLIYYIDNEKLQQSIPISLLWNEEKQPSSGELWLLKIKTKVSHGYLNEGGFDSQRFSIANRKLLIGTIKNAQQLNQRLDIRQHVVNLALPYLNLFKHKDILVALTFGDRTLLTDDHKQIMYQTGTAHLLAISGMHISLVAMLGFIVFRMLQFFMPARLIGYHHPYLFSWLAAFCYAYLTGFSPPALRAILALSLWLTCSFSYIYLSAWQLLLRVVTALLFIDPLTILSESFWLSCYAVACLVFISHWGKVTFKMACHKIMRYFLQLLHVQFMLTLLLLPIQFFIFQGISQFSIIANLIAIPIISLITFPAIVIALLCSIFKLFYGAILFWMIADTSVNVLFTALSLFHNNYFFVSNTCYLLSGLGWLTIFVCQTRAWHHYYLSILLLLLVLISPMLVRPKYQWRIDMLDVGHGLAVVISQGKSAILYDTGARWSRSDAAERVIIPFLRWHGLTLEGVIISHEHNDHIGGLQTVKKYYPESWLMSSSSNLNNNYLCISGQQVNWQQLTISVLWPNHLHNGAFNAASCVIRITDGSSSILLTGDLEKNQEEQMVIKYREQLFSTFLQTPHHGSNTSSFYPFLSHIKPEVSLVSTARYNPWKLPSHKAMARYHELNYSYYLTSETGQISIVMNNENREIATMRQQIKPRWYHDWFGGLAKYE